MSGRGEARTHSANPFLVWHDQSDSCRGRGMPPAAQQQQQKVLQQQLDIQQQAAHQSTQHRVGFVPPPPPRNIPRGDGPPPVPPRKRPPPPPPPAAEPPKDSPPPSYSDLYSPPPRRYSHTAADIQLLPPPRCNPARKFSEGSVPAAGYKFNSKRGATVILPPPIKTDFVEPKPEPDKISERQDSNVSSDSFSQSSSPSYTNKSMEAPLLPNITKKKRYQIEKELAPIRLERKDDVETIEDTNTSPITKSHSTPASLQTIVRLQTGSSMSLHHRIIRDIRRPSSHYMKNNRLRCHFLQVTINVLAIIAIAGGLAIYFKAYPNTTVRYVNRTVTTTKVAYVHHDVNPAPGLCLPVIVPFCIHHEVPYNYTIFPNYVGHFNQRDASQELEVYDALVDVRCYELASLFLCSIFVPKCGANGSMVRPCKNLCYETKRRCGFFLEVFGLALPPYLDCDLFPSSEDTDICIGHKEVLEAEQRAKTPKCTTGFQCDVKRCIPPDWWCDGHVDCEDQTDELNCESCPPEMIHCGNKTCITQSHMCDGEVNCPWGQDERNCLRLSEKMGDEGQGKLEIFQPELQSWRPACVQNWNENTSAKSICNFLGYGEVNSSQITTKATNGQALLPTSVRGTYKKKKASLNLKELRNCPTTSYATLDLTCHNVLCGQRRVVYQPSKRIIGGVRSTPGDWPFLAALLGGPEQVFYCAGVLISDQWVLTASHCVGNHGDTSGWTIQLGITRRHAHSYFGQKAKVKRVVPHPMYNIGIAHDNDVALFQLQQKVTFHEHLVPVCLPEEGYVLKPDTFCTVIGWGKREDSDMSEYEATVNEVKVPVLNRSLCNKWLEPRDLNVTQGMICAGYKEGGKDACQGDSGGPLLCRANKNVDRWFVGGIVSWGIKCAHPRLPGVYAYVPHYVPWIKEQIARYSD